MERDYSIKLTDLKRKLRYLNSINDGSDLIVRDIACLEAVIRRVKSGFVEPYNDEDITNYEDIVEDAVTLNNASGLISILDGLDFQSVGNPLLNRHSQYTTLYLSDSDAVDLAHDFYRTHASIFYNNYLDVHDYLENRLQFIAPNNNTDGEMIRINSLREAYIYVPDKPNITKATILIHEIQHAIDGVINDKFVNNAMIKEAAAMFMELIGSEYVSQKVGLHDDGTLRRAEVHSIVLTDSLYLMDKVEMFRDLGGSHVKDLESFFSILRSRDYTDDDISANLMYTADSLLSYQLPHLLAIELYYIYKKDKYDALEYLNGIINYCNDDNILGVLKECEIKLGEHYYKYQDSLVKKLQLKRER